MGGENKAFLKNAEGEYFLSRLLKAVSGFDEVLISTNEPEDYAAFGIPTVRDAVSGRGPLGGLSAALSVCESDGLLVVPCDLPFFSREMAEYLCSFSGRGWNAWAFEDSTGKLHPLCGVYRKAALPVIRQELEMGRGRVREAFSLAGGRVISAQEAGFSDLCFANINTPEAFARFCERSEL